MPCLVRIDCPKFLDASFLLRNDLLQIFEIMRRKHSAIGDIGIESATSLAFRFSVNSVDKCKHKDVTDCKSNIRGNFICLRLKI